MSDLEQIANDTTNNRRERRLAAACHDAVQTVDRAAGSLISSLAARVSALEAAAKAKPAAAKKAAKGKAGK